MTAFWSRHIRCYREGDRIVRHDIDCQHRDEHEQRPGEAQEETPPLAGDTPCPVDVGYSAECLECGRFSQCRFSADALRPAEATSNMTVTGPVLAAASVSDATAFVEAAGSVEFGPRRSEAQNNQTVAQAVEWPAAVGTRDEGAFVERVCKLLSKVWHHFDPGSHQPNDCICLSRKPWQKDSFQHSQQSVAWLEALVERELGQRSVAAAPVEEGLGKLTSYELLRQGGEWLGAARKWLQWNTRNGDQVMWGSGDLIEPQLSVRQIEDLASEVAAAAMRPQPSEQRLDNALKARWKAEARAEELQRAIGVMVPTVLRAYLETTEYEPERKTTWDVLKRVNDAMGKETAPLETMPGRAAAKSGGG